MSVAVCLNGRLANVTSYALLDPTAQTRVVGSDIPC